MGQGFKALAAFALAVGLCAASDAATVTATFTGKIVGSSDARNVLGYGGGSSADGARVTLWFQWDTATAAADVHAGARAPAEADYFTTNGVPVPGVLPPSWVNSRVIFDNGFILESAGYIGDEDTTDQVKIQDHCVKCSFDVLGGDSWDYYGVHDIIYDNPAPGIEVGHKAGGLVYDYTENLTSGLLIDQMLAWAAGAPGSYYALGVFQYEYRDLFAPENSYRAYGDIEIDSLTVVSSNVSPVPLPAAAWLLLSGLAGIGFAGRRRKAA